MRLRWAVISVLITGLLLALRHVSPSIAAGSNPVPQKLSLWPPELAPPYDHRISAQLRARLFPNPPLRDRDLSRYRPSMQTFLLSVATPRPAVLVFPGGGYGMLSQREGLAVCRFLNQRAKVHAILVKYRVQRAHPAPLTDARRALQIVRTHAKAWNVDPDMIGVLGFSAGAHLAGQLALSRANMAAYPAIPNDPPSRQSFVPSFVMLAYPVVIAGSDPVDELPVAGTNRAEPYGVLACTSYSCVGNASQPRPIRHHGSIEVLLGHKHDQPEAQVVGMLQTENNS